MGKGSTARPIPDRKTYEVNFDAIFKKTKDAYASEAETDALIIKDERTDDMRLIDKLLDERGANEQGAESYKILYGITLELLANARKNK